MTLDSCFLSLVRRLAGLYPVLKVVDLSEENQLVGYRCLPMARHARPMDDPGRDGDRHEEGAH